MKKGVFCFCIHLIILVLTTSCPVLATTITSYEQNASTVGRYEKFEITFTLDQTYSNPFDPRIVDITVDFYESDEYVGTIPAFYYQSFAVSGSNPETYTTAGATSWKARFAPSRLGNYTFDIIIRDGTGISPYYAVGSFECVQSNKKGFIRVDPNNPAFMKYDDGDTLLNIGQNIGWNNGSIPGGGIAGWNYYLTKMHNAGANWVRLWNCRYGADGGTLLEWKNGTYGGYFQGAGKLSMQISLRLDKYVEIAEQNGVNIQLAMQHHGQFSTNVNPDWNDNPYRDVAGGWLSNPAQFFTDADAIRYTKNKYRYIISRWGYSPAIFAWELFNEVQFTNGWQSNQASVVSWHDTMADYIHSIDPFQHPVTTSSNGSGFENIWNLADINLVEVHYYGNDTIRTFEQTALGLTGFNKPVIMAEFGLGGDPPVEGSTQPEPMATQLKEGLEMHNGIWSSFLAKSSAHLWWWDNYIDPCNLYGVYTPLAIYAQNENLADQNLVRAQRACSGAEAYFASPLLGDFWAISTQKVFYLSVDYFPGMENLSRYLHGSDKETYGVRSDPNFHLNMLTSGNLKIHVESTANWCQNSLKVLVNGVEVFTGTYPKDYNHFTITVPLSAGQQSVQIVNTGLDWFNISSYEFAPTSVSALDSIGLVSNERAYIWIYDVNSQYGLTNSGTFHNEPVIVKGLDSGNYIVDVYATRGAGGVIATGNADSVSGTLTYTLPDFSRDIAVKVRPHCPVGIEDLAAFCSQWLWTGEQLDSNLAGGPGVDFADFNVLADYWLQDCPPSWPY